MTKKKAAPFMTALLGEGTATYSINPKLSGLPATVRSLLANTKCNTVEAGMAAVAEHLLPYLRERPSDATLLELVEAGIQT